MFHANGNSKVVAISSIKYNFSPVLQNSNGSVLKLYTEASVGVASFYGENGTVE
jgi:hypothetical protein